MADKFRQLSGLFAECVDLPPAERRARLARIEDPSIRAELEDLLAADAGASGLTGGVGRPLDRLTWEPPERLPGYTLIRRLGAGGMGVVYEAEQERPRRRVAVKTLLPWLQLDGPVSWFEHEAQAMAGVVHPNIPQLYEVFEHEGLPFIAMEFVPGIPLHDWVQGRALDPRVRVLRDVASAVAFAHERGVVHGDVKPGNVLVTPAGQPKLLDFGLARLRGASHGPSQVAGTPAYMAPERAQGAPDAAADVWSLGMMLVVVASGALPGEPRAPLDDEGLERVAARALSPDPSGRADAAAFAADLDRWLNGQPVTATRVDWPYWMRVTWRRRRRAFSAAAVVLVAGAAAMIGAQVLAEAERRANANLAGARWEVVRGAILEAARDGDGARAATATTAFLARPAHVGTGIDASVWSDVAEADEAGAAWDAALVARARAWLAEDRDDTRLALATALASNWRWDGVRYLLEDRARSADERARLDQANAALRRVPGLTPALWVGTETAWGPDVDWVAGDRRAEPMFATQAGEIVRVAPGPTLADRGRDRLPVITPARYTRVFDGQSWLFAATGASRYARYRVLPTGFEADGAWETTIPQAVTATSDGRVFAGTGPYERNLRELLPGGARASVAPDVDRVRSDVSALVAGDLDGDGAEELAIAHGPWRGFEVRLLRPRPGPGDLAFLGSAPMGTPMGLVTARAGDGVRLAVLYAGRGIGSDPRYDTELHLRVLRVVGDTLVVEADHVLPRRAWCYLFAADVDGDGRDELVVSGRDDDTETLVVHVDGWRGEPMDGVFAVGAVQADADPADELVAQIDGGRFWVLGAGTTPLPPRPAAAADPPLRSVDPALRRDWEVARGLRALGLRDAADRHFERLAQGAMAPADRAALLAERTGAQHERPIATDAPEATIFAAGEPEPPWLVIREPEWGRWDARGLVTHVFDTATSTAAVRLVDLADVVEVSGTIDRAAIGVGAGWSLQLVTPDARVGVGEHLSGGQDLAHRYLYTIAPAFTNPYVRLWLSPAPLDVRVLVDRRAGRARLTAWAHPRGEVLFDRYERIPVGFGSEGIEVQIGGGLPAADPPGVPHGVVVWERLATCGARLGSAPAAPPRSALAEALAADARGSPEAVAWIRAISPDDPVLSALLAAHEARGAFLLRAAYGDDVLFDRYADAAATPDGAAERTTYLVTPMFDGLMSHVGSDQLDLAALALQRAERFAAIGEPARACAEARALAARIATTSAETAAEAHLVCYDVVTDPAARAEHAEAFRSLAPSRSYADRVLAARLAARGRPPP